MMSEQMVIGGRGEADARAAQTLREQSWRGGVAIVEKRSIFPVSGHRFR